MSLLVPATDQTMDPPLANDSICRVQHVIPTGAVFAATLERLNRKSAMALYRELVQELDDHGRRLVDADKAPREVSPLRAELAALLALLRETTEQHRSEVALVEQQLGALQEQNTKAQAGFEQQLSTTVSAQVQQQLLRTLSEASSRQEQSISAAIERDLKPISIRLTEVLASHAQRARRTCLLWILLALLSASVCFMLGLFTARHLAPVPCMPTASSGASVTTASKPSMAIAPSPQSDSAQAVLALASTQKDAAVATCNHPEAAGFKAGSAKFAAPAANVTSGDAPQAAPLAIAGLKLQPGTMEADMLEFLRRPGPHTSHTFTMDRLRYPPDSHEVNEDGKEQVFLLAKILLAYPSVHIEIRGHNDSTESERYTGPNPLPGYSLSQLRANCVLQRLQGLRVPLEHMRIRGLGSSQPVADDRRSEGRQHNRRVEIVVLSS